MRKNIAFLLAGGILFFTGGGALGAEAAAERPWQLGGFAGGWRTEDLRNGLGGGIVLQRTLGPAPAVSGQIAAGYFGDFDTGYTSAEIGAAEAGLLLHLGRADTMNYYAGAGMGYYFFENEQERIIALEQPLMAEYPPRIEIEADIGFHLVAGLSQALTKSVRVFLEVRYIWLDAEVRAKGNAGDGSWNSPLDLSGPGARAGLTWSF